MVKHVLEQDIKNAFNLMQSTSKAAKFLGISYDTYKKLALKYNIFQKNQGSCGKSNPRIIDELLFIKSSTKRSNQLLKTRLLLERQYICNTCNIETWQNLPLVLELNHINGDRFDNRKENLEFLCPNCHSQTKTFRGRNTSVKRKSIPTIEQYIAAIKSSRSKAEVIKKLKLTTGSYMTIDNIIANFNVSLKGD